MNRESNLKSWVFSILISLFIESPFVLLFMQGPHSTSGGIGMLFFLPSFGVVSLLSIGRMWFAVCLACQTMLLSIPVFWMVTWRLRSLSATVLHVSLFMVLLVAATSVLARYERHQWERQDAIKRAADNAVVSDLAYLNKSLAAYTSTYGQYPVQLDELSFPADGHFGARHAGLLRLPLPMEEFFAFSYSARGDASGKLAGYEIYVDPKPGKWSDSYHYFTDESGLIRFETTHTAAKRGLVVSQQLHPSVTVQ